MHSDDIVSRIFVSARATVPRHVVVEGQETDIQNHMGSKSYARRREVRPRPQLAVDVRASDAVLGGVGGVRYLGCW